MTNPLDRRFSGPILFVEPDDEPTPEVSAAAEWLFGEGGLAAERLSVVGLPEAKLGRGTTLWFHWDQLPVIADAARVALDAHVRAGGGVLATLAAATLPAQLRWEETGPNEVVDDNWTPDACDASAEGFSVPRYLRGLQSFRGHPLFDGLGSGVYTWAPSRGERYVRYAYVEDVWPDEGRVVGVEKSFITVNDGRRLAWEYSVGEGWLICIGGYVYFAANDAEYRSHLGWLVRNALARVAPIGKRPLGGEWRPPSIDVRLDADVPVPGPIPDLARRGPRRGEPTNEIDHRPPSPRPAIALSRDATEEPFTLAGARGFVVGCERTGIEEIWFHPNRAVSGWRLSAAGLHYPAASIVASRFRVSPGRIERRLRVGERQITEILTVAPEAPVVLCELVPDGEPADLVWTIESDLRLMWPYPPHAVGRLSYAVQGGSVGVAASTGEWLGVRIEPAPTVLSVSNVSDEKRSRLKLRAELEVTGRTRILLVGAARGESTPVTLAQLAGSGTEPERRQGRLNPKISPPVGEDPELGEAVEWARWRLSTYRVHVPDLGTSLVAGYARSGKGDFADGRPGYAWFFGRDACWSALAFLALGELSIVREVLEFLGCHQDITGKILHECTTSGVVHYDAADSTPLYLLLASRYLRVSGDTTTIRREWSRIRKAYEYCLSTDRDGDGLIENSGVGHGWVEFGHLGFHHVSLYLAAVWTAALCELETAARRLGEAAFADELAYRAAAARSGLELSFFDPLTGRYASGRRSDGSLDLTENAVTAVPLLLGAVRPERCETWLRRVASDDFTAPWGVRMLPRSDPGYRAEGYHTGSVWPLYGGWVSLAELAANRGESAVRHWRQTARLYKSFTLGAWPEVVHGDELRRLGVTPDQAWSTAMVLLPLFGFGDLA